MFYTGLHSESRFDNKGSGTSSPSSAPTEPGDDKASGQPALSFAAVVSMTCQILSDRNFQLFVVMNFFQVFMLAFFNNFTMIITEHLIPLNVLPPLAKSLMYGAGFICPQVTVHLSISLTLTLPSLSLSLPPKVFLRPRLLPLYFCFFFHTHPYPSINICPLCHCPSQGLHIAQRCFHCGYESLGGLFYIHDCFALNISLRICRL